MEEFMDLFDREYFPLLTPKRDGSFRAMFGLLGPKSTVVEIGSVRTAGNWVGDGQSTVMFDSLAKLTGAKVYSVDIDPNTTQLATLVAPNVECINADSVEWLDNYKGPPIDLLYLDGASDLTGWQAMREFEKARPHLNKRAVVAIDDTIRPLDNFQWYGKGALLGPYMLLNQVPLLLIYYQAVWLWSKK